MEGSRHVGHLSIQISGQNMKVVRPDGQIIQGPQLIQGPLDHCTNGTGQSEGWLAIFERNYISAAIPDLRDLEAISTQPDAMDGVLTVPLKGS